MKFKLAIHDSSDSVPLHRDGSAGILNNIMKKDLKIKVESVSGSILGNDRGKCKQIALRLCDIYPGTKQFVKFRKQRNKDCFNYKIEIK